MVKHHKEYGIVELYLVAFGVVDVDVDVEVEVHGEEGIVDEEEEEEYERVSVDRSDPFWDQVLTDDSDAYDLDADVGLEYDDVGVDEGFGLQPEDVVDQEVGVEAAVGEAEEGEGEGAGGGQGEGEGYSDIFGSDGLISPIASDEEGAVEAESSRRPCVTKRVPFSKDDLKDPILQRGNTF
jgi:hypothetical protein